MKISVVTVVYNNVQTIGQAIESVLSQQHQDVEYIIIDGGSTDGTLDVIGQYREKINVVVSENDKGLYDAMNKGVRNATGDVVGILNSDDIFHNNYVLSKIASAFDVNSIDATIGDIEFIHEDNFDKVLRKYSARKWHPGKFTWGYMPPHPSFFVRRNLFEQLGYYKTDYKIAADYELLIRYLRISNIKWKYIPLVTTKMRMGGASTKNLKSIITLNKEILRGCRENGLYTNYFMIYSKYIFKWLEFLK